MDMQSRKQNISRMYPNKTRDLSYGLSVYLPDSINQTDMDIFFRYISSWFGGFSCAKIIGGYMSLNQQLAIEDNFLISSFTNYIELKTYFFKWIKLVVQLGKKYHQEAILIVIITPVKTIKKILYL